MLKKLFLSLAVGAASALVFVSCNSASNDVTASASSSQSVTVLPRLTNAQALPEVSEVYVSLWVEGAISAITEKAAFSEGQVTIPKIPKDKNFRLIVGGRAASAGATSWSWIADTTCEAGGNGTVKIVDMVAQTSISLPSLTSAPPTTAIEGTSTTISFTKPADDVTIYYTTDKSVPSATNAASKAITSSSSTSITVTTPTEGKASQITVTAVAVKDLPGLGSWTSAAIPVALNFDGIVNTPSANDSTLTSLTVANATGSSVGTLSPAFSKAVRSYTNNTIPASVSSVTVKATATATAANVTYNGGPSGVIDMTKDTATVVIVVTNGDATLSYTLNLKRAAPAFDTSLSALTTSAGALSPTFVKTIKSYSNTTIPAKAASVTLTATPTDPAASVTYNGATSGVIDMTKDTATVSILVTNGTKTNTYTVTLKRAAPSFDTTLSALTVSAGSLTPTFVKTTKSYSDVTIPATATSVTLTATATDAAASVTYNGAATGVIDMTKDTATVAIVVTNNAKSLTYTVTLKRLQPARDTTLKSLVVSSGTLSPVFVKTKQSYADTVADSISSVTITALPTDAAAKVLIGTDTVTSKLVTVPVGASSVVIKVVNGTKSLSYTLNLFRPSPEDTTVTGLTVKPGSLAFAPATKTYVVTYYDTITKVTLKATAKSSKATVTYGGVADSVVDLTNKVDKDTVDVPVVVTNGTKTNTYVVRFAIKSIASANNITVDATKKDLAAGEYNVTTTCTQQIQLFGTRDINVTIKGVDYTGTDYLQVPAATLGGSFSLTVVGTVGIGCY